MAHKLGLGMLLLMVLIAGCRSEATPTPEPLPDPLTHVSQAAENIRDADTFRLSVEVSGATYFFPTDIGNVVFRRATAQYVAPEVLQARLRILVAGLPTDVDVFSRAEDQWYKNDVLTGGRWINAPFSPGFNPESIIASDTGLQAAIGKLTALAYVGEETLESGAPVHHLRGTAHGADVSALLANLVTLTGEVTVEVYVHREQNIPVRFVIVQPDTVTDDEPEPTTWIIDVYDVNAPPEIDDPAAAATPDVTEAATAEASG